MNLIMILSESLKLLLDQTEDKASKMKQLLVKTKKDLADAKQKVSFCRDALNTHDQSLLLTKPAFICSKVL